MRRWLQKLAGKNGMLYDTVNIIIGAVFVVLVFLALTNLNNRKLLLFAVGFSGVLNALNGMRQYKAGKNRNMAMSMIFMGILIIFMAIVLFMNASYL